MLAEAEILGKLNYGKKGQLYVVGDVHTRIGNIGEKYASTSKLHGWGRSSWAHYTCRRFHCACDVNTK